MTNPCCAGHPCDDCNICRANVCCGTLSAEQRAQLEAAISSGASSRLVALLADEAGRHSSLADLVRVDAGRPSQALLPAARVPLALPNASTEHLPINAQKEVLHGIPARPTR
jgi:hypothetical protein